jgi:hypothetical protein
LKDAGVALVFEALVVVPAFRSAVVDELGLLTPINPIDGAMLVVTAVEELNL